MDGLNTATRVSKEIRRLALRAARALPASSPARRVARRRAGRPIDYMRYAEFEAVLADLELGPGMTVLDVSSPQWLSIYLADAHPDVEFRYINILDSELDAFREISAALELENLSYQQGDVRDLAFADETFDRVLSVSVIEHVYPEEGGDLAALDEIERVLRPGGELLLTVPYKSQAAVVYVDGPVYERGGQAQNFFAREYDEVVFGRLLDAGKLSLADSWFICERRGILPVDYYEWGPGKRTLLSRLIRYRRLPEVAVGWSADGILARRYLTVSRRPDARLVNIAARLRKG